VDLGRQRYDVVLAAAVLHHLRSDAEWDAVLRKIFESLRPGGCFWIVDVVEQVQPQTQAEMWRDYGEYLMNLGGAEMREQVLAYIEQEDSPRPLLWQLDRLRQAGFIDVDVLHKRLCSAAFGALRP
jgi:tRNA (cmo5U34)-methyltransferase